MNIFIIWLWIDAIINIFNLPNMIVSENQEQEL